MSEAQVGPKDKMAPEGTKLINGKSGYPLRYRKENIDGLQNPLGLKGCVGTNHTEMPVAAAELEW